MTEPSKKLMCKFEVQNTIIHLLSDTLDELFRLLMEHISVGDLDSLSVIKKINEAAMLKADLDREEADMDGKSDSDIIVEQAEIIERLTDANSALSSLIQDVLPLLAQYQSVEAEEHRFDELKKKQEEWRA